MTPRNSLKKPLLLGLATAAYFYLLLALAIDAKAVPLSNNTSLLPLIGLTGGPPSGDNELNCLSGGYAVVAFSGNIDNSSQVVYEVAFPETDSVWFGLVTSDFVRQTVYFWLATDQGGAFAESDGLMVGVKVQKQKQAICGGLVSAPFVRSVGPLSLNFYNGSVWGWEVHSQSDHGHLYSMDPNSGVTQMMLDLPANRELVRANPAIISNNGTFYTVMAGQNKQYLYIYAVDLQSLQTSEIQIESTSPVALCYAWDYDFITDTIYGVCDATSESKAKYLATIDLSTLQVTFLGSQPFVDAKYSWTGFTIDPKNGYAYIVAGPMVGGVSLVQASLQTGDIVNQFPLSSMIYDLAYAPWLLSQ
eukprot:TRINITY_DN3869_c0_g1_i1.p1 TRINITY_DN3869_c0_g1~~TRINITY_DN3869_c0_g1_i1.p1  ORF type:complete len:379 (+),score=66.04 TRINITY_DN3869_c0_g1_i1:55-1137(+)